MTLNFDTLTSEANQFVSFLRSTKAANQAKTPPSGLQDITFTMIHRQKDVHMDRQKDGQTMSYHNSSNNVLTVVEAQISVIFVIENENAEKRENNEFVNENEKMMKTKTKLKRKSRRRLKTKKSKTTTKMPK